MNIKVGGAINEITFTQLNKLHHHNMNLKAGGATKERTIKHPNKSYQPNMHLYMQKCIHLCFLFKIQFIFVSDSNLWSQIYHTHIVNVLA